MGRVVVVGSLNIDLVTRVERHPRPGETLIGEGLQRLAGGKGANQPWRPAWPVRTW
jgi:ribokinase